MIIMPASKDGLKVGVRGLDHRRLRPPLAELVPLPQQQPLPLAQRLGLLGKSFLPLTHLLLSRETHRTDAKKKMCHFTRAAGSTDGLNFAPTVNQIRPCAHRKTHAIQHCRITNNQELVSCVTAWIREGE